MSDPLFSIVIPTYNRADTIGRAIDSCLAQTERSFEIVVVDAKRSTDDMGAALAAYAERCTIRPRLDYEGSAAAARNEGARMARGRFVAFLDADDAWLPNKLEVCRGMLEREPDTLFYSQNYVDREVGKYWVKPARGLRDGEDIFDYLLIDRGWVHPSTIVVAAETARAHPFREELSFGDDTQFAVDLWRGGVRLRMIEAKLAIYHDPPEDPRRLSQSPVREAGRTPTHVSFLDWVESHREHMSEEAWAAYRSFWRSRFVAPVSTRAALGDIWSACLGGKIGLGRSLSQMIQTFAPHTYRRLSDAVVRLRGIDPSTIGTS